MKKDVNLFLGYRANLNKKYKKKILIFAILELGETGVSKIKGLNS